MIGSHELLQLHDRTVASWHDEDIANDYEGILHLVCAQHSFNFRLWHEEDIARSRDVTDEKIAEVKRNIDSFNQQRNDHIEKLDDWITGWLLAENRLATTNAPLNSETPGSIIDRMSIMSLRIYHLEEQTERQDVDNEHLVSVRRKLATCREQRSDLAVCLDQLLADIYAGRKRHKTYRQFKMYNDPTLNPYLYRSLLRKTG